jgi:hypothetical protein
MTRSRHSRRADDALGEEILPRSARCNDDLANAHALDPALEVGAVDGIAIGEQVSGASLVRDAWTICWAAHVAVGWSVERPWEGRPQGGVAVRIGARERDEVELISCDLGQGARMGPQQSDGARRDRVEHRLHVSLRAADDAQDVAGAVCCSRASLRSLFRASNSLNKRTFSRGVPGGRGGRPGISEGG